MQEPTSGQTVVQEPTGESRRTRKPGLATKSLLRTIDVAVLALGFLASYHLRFDFRIPPREVGPLLFQLPLVVGIQMAALQFCGVQRIVWRYVGARDLDAFLAAAACSMVPLLALRFGASGPAEVLAIPLSIIVMTTVLGLGGTLGARLARRLLVERTQRRPLAGSRPSVLLIGAGQAGVMAVRELQTRGGSELLVKGFVDDDPVKVGAVIYGVKVLGRTDDLPRLVRQHKIDQVIVTIADAPREALRNIVQVCQRIPVQVRSIPGLYEILQGSVSISRFREVPVEQLLDRSPLYLDRERGRQLVTGKVVMVSGAGGSIGAELTRQVAALAPAQLLLVERAEPALFLVDRELREAHPELDLVPLLADVGDQPRIRGLLELYRPHVVFHAAAHKHVPMMELNPIEAVKNNVLATETFAEACGESGAGTFVLISSDKAVRPTSIMGTSKRVAELVVQDAARRHRTRYVAVRFGNVLGSAGSVVPVFREQIARGGPVRVTHPDMVRFFMTIPEAASLVMEAAAMGAGGEIFILDMGEPVRVVDLARRLIELAGYRPDEDIEIVYTGTRPGEKLVEELGHETEAIAKTRHPKIYIGQLQTPSGPFIQSGLARLRALATADASEVEVRQALKHLVPEALFEEPAPVDTRREVLVPQPAR